MFFKNGTNKKMLQIEEIHAIFYTYQTRPVARLLVCASATSCIKLLF